MIFNNTQIKFYGSSKSTSRYLNDIRKYKVLTPEEEIDLFNRYHNGDTKAREELILRNQRFIFSLAKMYAKNEEEVSDYVGEGNIGLAQAIDEFDVERGLKFMTLAVWYIRRSMNYYLSDKINAVTKTNNMKLGKKIAKIKDKFYTENEYMPTDEQVIEIFRDSYDIKINDVSDIFEMTISSINEEVKEDYTVEEQSDFNNATASINAYENDIENEYVKKAIEKIMVDLPVKYQEFIKMYYGIGYENEVTMEMMCSKYNMYPDDIVKMKNNVIEYIRQNQTRKMAI